MLQLSLYRAAQAVVPLCKEDHNKLALSSSLLVAGIAVVVASKA